MPETIIENQAAWLPAKQAPTCEVGPAPMPAAGENEVVIQVAYAAVNPTDWVNQDTPYMDFPYPWILGTDVAGTVAQIGEGVTRFKLGQRVIGHCDSILTLKAERSGYQRYTVCREILVAEIPDKLELSRAVVLPLSISTAACALFKHLNLPFPAIGAKKVEKTLLVWGGSSSVGSTAIQLALGAGYTVAATAGEHNLDYLKSLGATYCFNHKDPNVIENILKVLKTGDVVFDAISQESSQKPCAEIISKVGGGKLAVVLMPLPTEYDNVKVEFVSGGDPGLVNLDIGDAVWRKYVPQALAAGKFQAKPDSLVLDGGLKRVQEGIDLLRKGVSAKKIVIEVDEKV